MKDMAKGLTRMAAVASLTALIFTGCVFTPGPDYGDEIAPPLPSVVELDSGPYYHYRDYHYRYEGERWHYSRDRNGPWRELPRSHWPKEIRRGGGEGRGRMEGGGEFRHEQERR
jgi:hypothetical protein